MCQTQKLPMIEDKDPFMKIKIPFLSALLLLAPFLGAQSTGFVSRVRADMGESQIIISWKNSQDYLQARHEIWRLNSEITAQNFSQATKIFTQPAGIQEFRDRPPTAGSYYYLILIVDPQKGQLRQFIPFRNKTTEAVEYDPDPPALRPTRILENSFEIEGDKVRFTLRSSNPERQIAVLRFTEYPKQGPQILTDTDSTLAAILIAGESTFEDQPPRGVEFWYAFADSRLFAESKEITLNNGNTHIPPVFFELPPETAESTPATPEVVPEPSTTPPVDQPVQPSTTPEVVVAPEFQFNPEVERALRALPLPRLNMSLEVETGTTLPLSGMNLPSPVPISSETRAILDQLLKTKVLLETPLPDPYILDSEKGADLEGTELELQKLIQVNFKTENWLQLETGLRLLLNKPLDSKVRNRGRFYLGQALVFQKRYQAAALEFISVQSELYQESNRFLDSILSMDL